MPFLFGLYQYTHNVGGGSHRILLLLFLVRMGRALYKADMKTGAYICKFSSQIKQNASEYSRVVVRYDELTLSAKVCLEQS
ncbi:MAG: hypothetical protein COV10_01515 [Candidatus Vogelbacteria bacterium CG10_big_fil_rev_8_21_14_0_10_51_16]|uniref:Uncharacterized protein n=1 Tax=Candidatus Vogelbacteria bacterium CG10_big_fil_rev_8_21_14_0_10_51_16 TaxID=1975045 RepID=A0A2H0RF72_9BACT|nr:MAG: hypothetical protein COV10_01515 [Candidatus Vogelbacteria bacterium CG10_big_fil_rev_8_21_14_0_10_51_16]